MARLLTDTVWIRESLRCGPGLAMYHVGNGQEEARIRGRERLYLRSPDNAGIVADSTADLPHESAIVQCVDYLLCRSLIHIEAPSEGNGVPGRLRLGVHQQEGFEFRNRVDGVKQELSNVLRQFRIPRKPLVSHSGR